MPLSDEEAAQMGYERVTMLVMPVPGPRTTDVFVHGPGKCEGERCTIHNPSTHGMRDWPVILRLDRQGLFSRVCGHGNMHPDPDSLEFMASFSAPEVLLDIAEHDCDGCCGGEYGD
jgi:hypothetical protein